MHEDSETTQVAEIPRPMGQASVFVEHEGTGLRARKDLERVLREIPLDKHLQRPLFSTTGLHQEIDSNSASKRESCSIFGKSK